MSGKLERCYNLEDLRKLARKRLPSPMYHYMRGGADDEWSLNNNTAAFDRYELLPRYLVNVEKIDAGVTVLGQELEWPLFLSPTGMSRIFHHEGEIGAARAAHRSGTMYSLSTLGSTSIEDVAAASEGPRMFQIYVLRDPGLNREFIERCREAKYSALCLTVDVPVGGNRERDFYTGMTVPPKLTFMSKLDVARHVSWTYRYLTSGAAEMANFAHRIRDSEDTNLMGYVGRQFDMTVDWDDAARMIEQWGGPFAIKGVMCAEDARRSVDAGASAVMLSNHGGRQLDGAPAPVDLVREVRDAIGDAAEVIVDGGVRRGTHVLKALALGATACSTGRGYLYGLGAGGEAGVDRALKILREEVERDLALLGCVRARDLDGRHVREVGRQGAGK